MTYFFYFLDRLSQYFCRKMKLLKKVFYQPQWHFGNIKLHRPGVLHQNVQKLSMAIKDATECITVHSTGRLEFSLPQLCSHVPVLLITKMVMGTEPAFLSQKVFFKTFAKVQ